jgi:hypothetical protein
VVVVWAALGVALAAIVAGLAVAVARGLRMWRDVKRLGKHVGEHLDAVSRATEEIETHLQRASEGSERLGAAVDRLARSRARLDVQRGALREARRAVTRAVPLLAYLQRR